MWWRRRRSAEESPGNRRADPVVVAVTQPLTGQLAGSIALQVDRLSEEAPVVIDVTGIPGFDSDGASTLARLQERHGGEQVSIIGFRQAAARLTGATDVAPARADHDGWTVHRMQKLAVVQAAEDVRATTAALEGPVQTALDADVAIVVVDLRGVILDGPGTEVLAFASSRAALRGQELLVVNVDPDGAEQLRQAGLSATTYVSPET